MKILKQNKVLIVDDDFRLREMVRMVLENRGYSVEEAVNGQDGVQKVKLSVPDLILLDVMMPVMDGFSACQEIRSFSTCPIIMLTAKGEDYDQVKGFGLGADDYVVKPFTPMVLAARIEAVLRRYESQNKGESEEVLSYGSIEVDLAAHTVRVDDHLVDLKKKEFELLSYLIKNHDISLSRTQLLENVWGYDFLGSEGTVDSHINRLRNQLGEASQYIKTVRGYGYKLGE
jgi:DNA-binding response OmpR family regulator